ncbi:MAG: Hint domain-containing protein, partial [Pseudomonadota bacterium]
TLEAGDLVCTADHGDQPVRWIGMRHLAGSELTEALLPIRIERNAFGGGFPRRDLTVSPQHRVVIRGPRLVLMTGEEEGLAPAKTLLGQAGVRRLDRTEVTYVHILFDDHQIVYSNGWATESLNPGDQAMSGFGAQARSEILDLFPELITSSHGFQRQARPLIKPHEVRAMAAGKPRS